MICKVVFFNPYKQVTQKHVKQKSSHIDLYETLIKDYETNKILLFFWNFKGDCAIVSRQIVIVLKHAIREPPFHEEYSQKFLMS